MSGTREVSGRARAFDLRQGGADWAFWVTITWGIGVAFHVAYYVIGDNGPQNRGDSEPASELEEEPAAVVD